MRFLKRIGWALLILLAMAGMTVAVSTIAERGAGETLFSAAGLRVTAVGAGGALALLVILLFAALRVRDCRKRGKPAGAGEWMNGIGFGVLPGAAVWKIFEQATTLSHGKSLFEPLPALPYVTEGGCFQPSRIDMILAGAGFAVLLGCMIVRRKDYPGNGELLLRVLSVWTVVCALTENFRAEPLFRAGNVNLTQIIFLLMADICLAVRAARKIRAGKSTAFAVPEYTVALCCEIGMVLVTAGVLDVGSGIGNFAVIAGCAVLCIVIAVTAGRETGE